ncbi:type III secretion system translocon subunit SctB [Achromobacter deleyi]|uniref:type III secretion system translocon subunit SctB n=1 Tax=Achromobacter deleyi TaxID=1353891 RepID=UPI001491A79A|nr:type III secretion system translocon subunit SctB [Achromobacter deleyi]QVQ24864.1 type III secretion system translocon subunit SctB [Achromobacter deleyi]UIP20403.1 type III secretion system translocon subunit SctB [Achromobacter deleyi]
MTISPTGAGGSNPLLNIEDMMKSASPDVLKTIVENAQTIAAENEALTQKLMGSLGSLGAADAAAVAQMGANIEKMLQDIKGGARGLQAPEGKLGSDAAGTLDQVSRLSEQDVQTDLYAFMALFQQLAQAMRTSAREVRQSEMTAQVDALKGAAQEIRNAAQERMVGAMVSGAFQIAGGIAQAGSGVMQGRLLANGGSESVAKSYSDRAAGVSGMASGIGTMVNASQERKAAEHDAKKAELEAQSKVHDSATQQATEMAQQMMDVIRDVREKLSSIEQSRMETNRGIARNI